MPGARPQGSLEAAVGSFEAAAAERTEGAAGKGPPGTWVAYATIKSFSYIILDVVNIVNLLIHWATIQ
jgi:hypothetical protein